MLQRTPFILLSFLMLFSLTVWFASEEQKNVIVWTLIFVLMAAMSFVLAALFRFLFKEKEYQPNENGDFPIIRSGGLFSKKQFINLNAIGTSYSVGQEYSLKDFQAMALHRFTSGRFGTPPASVFGGLNPFQELEEYPMLPPRIIQPDDLQPPLLLEAKNTAQDL